MTGQLPLHEWPGVLIGLMEHIERQREPLTTCGACGALVRPSEHCPGCAVDAYMDDLMADAFRREMLAYTARMDSKAAVALYRRTESGRFTVVDAWALFLSLPLCYILWEYFTRY